MRQKEKFSIRGVEHFGQTLAAATAGAPAVAVALPAVPVAVDKDELAESLPLGTIGGAALVPNENTDGSRPGTEIPGVETVGKSVAVGISAAILGTSMRSSGVCASTGGTIEAELISCDSTEGTDEIYDGNCDSTVGTEASDAAICDSTVGTEASDAAVCDSTVGTEKSVALEKSVCESVTGVSESPLLPPTFDGKAL